MVERAICLGLEIRKLFLCAGEAGLLVRGKFVQRPERMLDALDCPDRIRRVEIRKIRRSAADE